MRGWVLDHSWDDTEHTIALLNAVLFDETLPDDDPFDGMRAMLNFDTLWDGPARGLPMRISPKFVERWWTTIPLWGHNRLCAAAVRARWPNPGRED